MDDSDKTTRAAHRRPPRLPQPPAILLIALATVFAAGALSWAPAPQPPTAAGRPAPQLSLAARTLYPGFDPRRHRYVVRCEGGSVSFRVRADRDTRVAVGPMPEQSGRFRARLSIRPGQDFAVRESGRGRGDSYSVRCLPEDFPSWRFRSLRHMKAGLFTVTLPSAASNPTPWVIVFDNSGMPRWWYSPGTSALGGQITPDGTISWSRSFGDGYGVDPRMAHEVRSLSGRLLRLVRTRGTVTDSHEFQQLPGGDVLLEAFQPQAGIDLRRYGNHVWHLPHRASVVFPEVEEIDPSGRLVWRWSSRGRVGLEETSDRWWDSVRRNPHPGPGGAPTYDPFHINSIDPWGHHRLVVSMRHTNAVYGIERSTGSVLWKLGGTHTPASLRVIGDPHGEDLFGGQHDARITSHGRLSFFDNAKDRGRPPRAVWYDLDLARGTATFVRQLTDPIVRESHCCGSVRPTAGGWIVDWGRNPLVTGFDRRGRIAFRLHLPISTYRAVPVPRGAVTARGLERGMEAMEPGSAAAVRPEARRPPRASPRGS
jgi:Arylsulfotransferase (ASST)